MIIFTFIIFMGKNTAYHFFNQFRKDRFCLAYMGSFDDELTEILMRSNETSVQESQKLKKRLSFLIAECFQNVIRHSDEPEVLNSTNNKPTVFVLRNHCLSHYISSSNLISNEKKDGLEAKLNTINTLSSEELKALYLNSLAHDQISEKGGGGLGLIEMARKSGSPIDFSFEHINYYHSIFFMQVHFDASDKELNDTHKSDATVLPITDTKELYHKMIDEQIVFLRKGDFSQETIIPLIGLLENDLRIQTNFSGSKKKAMYMLVELLQNISKHGLVVNGEREGIFIVSKKDNRYVLTSGNYVKKEDVVSLRDRLESIVNLNQDELKELYKSVLMKKEPSERGNAGIGLIELCRYSNKKVEYSFNDVDDSMSFYTLSIVT
ncbi:MAG: SiaB family protein kinase [Bacteroidia bacterium]|nr:SiaB family protein kinase [Bacteroidia bacterium]